MIQTPTYWQSEKGEHGTLTPRSWGVDTPILNFGIITRRRAESRLWRSSVVNINHSEIKPETFHHGSDREIKSAPVRRSINLYSQHCWYEGRSPQAGHS